MALLKVQAAQHAALGVGVVILHEVQVEPRQLGVSAAVMPLHKEPPLVAMHVGLNDQHAGQPGLMDLHHPTPLAAAAAHQSL